MKKLMLMLFVLTATVFSNDLQAQANCTAAQKAACKKICADKTACTPAEMAACKKVCATKVASTETNAVKLVNKSPEKLTANETVSSETKASPDRGNEVKLVGFDLPKKAEAKKTECSKTCGKKKE